MFFFYLALHFLFLKLPRVLFHYLKLFSCSLQNYFPPKLTNYFSKTSSTNDANILAVNIPDLKGKPKEQSFEQDLLDMLEKLQQLRLEKEKTDELLKAKDEILKQKDEELQNSGKEQENLQIEFKKLQKLKEFKPTTNFPMVKDKEQKKKDRKGALTWKHIGLSRGRRRSSKSSCWSNDGTTSLRIIWMLYELSLMLLFCIFNHSINVLVF
uniref:High mobility group B protein 6-like isoform X2 n=1 Tax=Cicer arietinum TaxID=3827 RepID=A0A3Q7XI09_CICAR|nr:high mobility group B protein 6-like isoform X2 [Cicer arietinum]